MTNTEYRLKYPIGTKIRWVLDVRWANDLAKKDIGKTGTIVGYDSRDCPFIFLSESEHKSSNSTQTLPISWWADWEDIEIVSMKNQQLLFSFMSEAT